MADSSSFVLATTPEAHVRVLSINRSQKRNALSQVVIKELLRELDDASRDDDVKVIVITGTDSLFCAGADIKEIAALDSDAAEKGRYLEDLCNGLQAVKKPLIAAVEGIAFGGGFELALMCDIILASTIATFGLPEVKIGVIPGAGGTQRLTSAVGKYRAMKMILTGAPITAAEAHSFGLVAELFEAGTVLKQAVAMAKLLAQNSPSAMALARKSVNRADALGRDDEFERTLYYSAFSSHDKIEGVSAFLEKRKPQWKS